MPRYRKAVLLLNPVSGSRSDREKKISDAAEVLRPLADSLTIEPTRAAGSGTQQAHEAIDAGCDLILVAGGDGTVFEVLQAIATTNVTLGVIPLGTGNVLAVDLAMPSDPVAAARQLLTYEPRRISLGRISPQGSDPRYFTVAAGVGVHAELIYNAGTAAKRHTGIAAYYASGFRLLFAHRFVPFTAEITMPDGKIVRDEILEMVAMRVSSFGRWLKRWRPGSSLESPHLRLVVLKQSSRWAMLLYVFGALTGRAHTHDLTSRSADVHFIPATRVRCFSSVTTQRIRAQADGERLGTMPADLEIVPDALTLLMPKKPSN
jgi:diacylglycerol kinase (ATP)